MSEPVAAPKRAPLELRLRIMQRNWSYPEFREVLFREARECEDNRYANVYKRLYAYLRALELRERGLSQNRIKEVIYSEAGFKPLRCSLSQWLRGVRTPLGRIPVFDVRLSEVGLVMGLILSDGSEYQHKHRGRFISACQWLSNTDEEILEEFRRACNVLGLRVRKARAATCQRLVASSMLLHLLLKRFDELIMKTTLDVQLAFLRGLWLGDGYVGSAIKLRNTDLRIINVTSTLLRAHGIEHTVRGPYTPHPPGKKPIYEVCIRSCSRKRFLKLTGLADNPPRP